jgi:enoyl-[acyl-carrier protein] reductase II
VESSAHESYKHAIVGAADSGTVLFAKKIAPVRALKNRWVEEVRAAEARGATREDLERVYGHHRSRLGILEGDVDQGELEMGQSSGVIHEILPAAEVVRRFVQEFEAGRARIQSLESR